MQIFLGLTIIIILVVIIFIRKVKEKEDNDSVTLNPEVTEKNDLQDKAKKGKENNKKNSITEDSLSNNDQSNLIAPSNKITYHGNYIDIDHLDFFGKYNKSNNAQYTIAYSEHPQNKYVLLKKDKVISSGQIERPQKAKIANNGNFIITNWGVSSNLQGSFRAFTQLGDLIIREEFKANIYNCSISNDGNYALCHTCFSKYEDDSLQLLFFDLKNAKLLWKQKSLPQPANKYSLNIKRKLIKLIYNKKKVYHYSFSGEFLDQELWSREKLKEQIAKNKNISKDQIKSIDINQLFEQVELEHKNNLEEYSSEELTTLLNKFELLSNLEEIIEVKYKHARIYRYIGEIHLELGNKKESLDNFETALKINKRVGVKRIIKQLQKELKK